ncbi:MAG: ArsR family transcriptional regulator [Bacteroidota bacterium]
MENLKNKKLAKTCYTHIGGKLGRLLLEQFIDLGWLKKNHPSDKHFFITTKGEKEFANLGVDLTQIKAEPV